MLRILLLHIPKYCSAVLPIFHQEIISLSTLTFPTAPGPVYELRYEEITDTSVRITWNPPKEPNGVIVEYIVEHGVYQDESTRNVTIDARRPTHTVIQALGKLLPFLIYVTQAHLSANVCNSHNFSDPPTIQALVNQVSQKSYIPAIVYL